LRKTPVEKKNCNKIKNFLYQKKFSEPVNTIQMSFDFINI